VPGRDSFFSVCFESDIRAGTITPIVKEERSPDTVTDLPNFTDTLGS
jgi:hypothetical protein